MGRSQRQGRCAVDVAPSKRIVGVGGHCALAVAAWISLPSRAETGTGKYSLTSRVSPTMAECRQYCEWYRTLQVSDVARFGPRRNSQHTGPSRRDGAHCGPGPAPETAVLSSSRGAHDCAINKHTRHRAGHRNLPRPAPGPRRMPRRRSPPPSPHVMAPRCQCTSESRRAVP